MVSKLVILILILNVLCDVFVACNLKLEQVLIFSRHNIRYPICRELQRYSRKPWPAGSAGFLTQRGGQLEGYMGEYFSEWFKREQFLTGGCPDEDSVYVYANTANRTKATARAFIDSVFKSCNVTVHHKNTTKADPIFKPAIHNTTEAFKNMVIEEMNRKLQNNSKLQAVYSELNKILEIEESDVCKQDRICDLTGPYTTISYKVGENVWGKGPFFIGISSVDAFVMSYYSGMPIRDIAWGKITTLEEWMLLTEIGRQDHNMRYATFAADTGAPLVEYLTRIFKNYDKMPKLILLVGHDYNMNSIAASLGLESINLPNQFEKYPIGGKYVFQRWTDNKSDYLKIEYVYPSWSQLRNGSKYSLESPPERVVLRLNWCNMDEHGLCPWNDFVNKL